MGGGRIRRLAISVRKRSSEEPSAEGRTDLALPRPHYPGDGLAHSSDTDVQCLL